MATFKEMESLAKESVEESDETIRKVYWSLPLFDAWRCGKCGKNKAV